MDHKITAIILAKNSAEIISNCIQTLTWVTQILVIDTGSDDNTTEIAESLGAQVIHFAHSSFARLRNEALSHVDTDWLFYIDADERVTPTLAKEILVHIETQDATVLSMMRQNICYGQKFNHGGWNEDEVTRVFKKEALKKWVGKVHESPEYEGQALRLRSPLIHLTHRNTVEGLQKTINWTPIEAELLFKSNLPRVTFVTIIRKGVMEFLRRGVFKKGYQDGMPGVIEAIVQGINKMLIYIQVWELQQAPPLEEQYHKQEIKIAKLWEDEDIKHFNS